MLVSADVLCLISGWHLPNTLMKTTTVCLNPIKTIILDSLDPHDHNSMFVSIINKTSQRRPIANSSRCVRVFATVSYVCECVCCTIYILMTPADREVIVTCSVVVILCMCLYMFNFEHARVAYSIVSDPHDRKQRMQCQRRFVPTVTKTHTPKQTSLISHSRPSEHFCSLAPSSLCLFVCVYKCARLSCACIGPFSHWHTCDYDRINSLGILYLDSVVVDFSVRHHIDPNG